MKRSVWVKVSLVLEGVWTLAMLGMAVSIWHSAAAAQARQYALLSLLHGIGWYGLWRRKLWGWWLASICSWGLAARIVYVVVDVVADNGWSVIDWGFVTALCYLVLPVCLLIPATRRYYWSVSKVSGPSLSP